MSTVWPDAGTRIVFPFWLLYGFAGLLVLALWGTAPRSHLMFAGCLWMLALAPYALQRYSLFEPLTIYLALFLPAFTLKPLLNDYLVANGEEFLGVFGGNEALYFEAMPVAAALVLGHVFVLHLAYSFFTRRKRSRYFELMKQRAVPSRISAEEVRLWRKTAVVAGILFLVAFAYFFVYVRGLNYADYALNRNEALRGQGPAWLFANLATPLAIVYVYLAIVETASASRRRLYLLLICLCVLAGQVIAPGRGNLLNILMGGFIVFWWKRGGVALWPAMLAGGLFAMFSIVILFLREMQQTVDSEALLYFVSADFGLFDFYVLLVGQHLLGLMPPVHGSQLLGNLYILLPRSLFPDKPLWFSTLEIQHASGLMPPESSHISVTSFAEWIYNFGFGGIVAGAVLLALALAFFFRLLATRGRDIRLLAYALVLPMFCIAHIKGGFSLGFVFLVLSPSWILIALYFGLRLVRLRGHVRLPAPSS